MRNDLMAAAASAVALAMLGTASIADTPAFSDNLTVRDGAKSLDFVNAPIVDVVAQFHRTFGGNIIIKPGVNADRNVNFTVSNIREPGAAIETVQDLANALGTDWQKSFVITQATGDDDVRRPLIDSDAPVVLKSTTMSAQDAIDLVASVDGATTKFYSPVSGTVHFSSMNLTAPQAAREIAAQTHTNWKAFYALAPRTGRSVPMGAKVIGRTSSGRPILELPTTDFRVPPPPPAVPAPDTTANAGNTDGQNNTVAAVPPMPGYPYNYMNPYAFNPYGYPVYGAPAYGYGPGYGYDPYGYGTGFVGNGLQVLPTAPVYSPPIVFGNH